MLKIANYTRSNWNNIKFSSDGNYLLYTSYNHVEVLSSYDGIFQHLFYNSQPILYASFGTEDIVNVVGETELNEFNIKTKLTLYGLLNYNYIQRVCVNGDLVAMWDGESISTFDLKLKLLNKIPIRTHIIRMFFGLFNLICKTSEGWRYFDLQHQCLTDRINCIGSSYHITNIIEHDYIYYSTQNAIYKNIEKIIEYNWIRYPGMKLKYDLIYFKSLNKLCIYSLDGAQKNIFEFDANILDYDVCSDRIAVLLEGLETVVLDLE